jgi:hypothetical protein
MNKRGQYWFRAKRYGWGWGPPVTWQGWGVLIGWLAVLIVGMTALGLRAHPVAHAVYVGVMVVALLLVCRWKGEPVQWRWGD